MKELQNQWSCILNRFSTSTTPLQGHLTKFHTLPGGDRKQPHASDHVQPLGGSFVVAIYYRKAQEGKVKKTTEIMEQQNWRSEPGSAVLSLTLRALQDVT